MNAPRSGPKAWMFATAAGALVLVTLVTGAVFAARPLLAGVEQALLLNSDVPQPDTEAAADPTDTAQAVAAEPSAAAAAPAGAAAAAGGVPTMLILDASGSMVRDVATGGTRMEAARAAATTMIDGTDPATELGLMVFGTGTGNSDAEQAAGCSDVRTLQPVGAIDKGAYTASIAGIRESGFTPIGPALRSAADQLPGAEPATIVLVTDGVDTCSPPSSCDVAREVLDTHPLLSIEVIGFAVDADEQAQSQLQCIATLGSGSYVDVADAAQLAARLRAATSSGDRVTASGYGAARLGMTLAQARATIAGLTVTKTTTEIVYVDCPDATLEFRSGILTLITPKADTPTADGVSIGADVAEATAIYGTPSAPTQTDDGWFVDYSVAPGSVNGYRIVYAGGADGVVAGRIIRIIVCTCGPSVSAANTVSSAVSSWQVSLDAVGPIRMGATFDEVNAVAPLVPEIEPYYCTWYRSIDTGGDAVNVSIASAQVDPYRVAWVSIQAPSASAAAPRTWRDAGLGQSLTELLAAHPDASVVRDEKYGGYVVLTGPSGTSLLFHLGAGDYVSGITLSETTIPPYEFCG